MSLPLHSLRLETERDVVLARQRARQIAALLGFEPQDQTRIATAVSEIARNAVRYAGGGRIEFGLEGTSAPQVLLARVADEGPGMADPDGIARGVHRPAGAGGLGLAGARRLVDRLSITSEPGRGTAVEMRKLLPWQTAALTRADAADLVARLARQPPRDPVEEVQLQNQELLRSLEELTQRQEELAALNRELEDTNRGVVALYAELDEKADHLRRADEIKTRFISNLSHEFRTPVNSIQALARLLLDQTDGPLSAEQLRQVGFIRKAADGLSDLVNDLLDLAKVEAGKTVVQPVTFEVAGLFGALRGMLRPLLVNETVSLVFEEPEGMGVLNTDEGKVSQILRNFISNALKFTERGEVRVAARLRDDGLVAFTVADTGIGIAPEDQQRIFDEFTQVAHGLQHRYRGTGLGLPLCRRLAELLGGSVSVESRPGAGSTFTALIPPMYRPAPHTVARSWDLDPARKPVLFVEDRSETLLLYEKYLSASPYQALAAHTLAEAHQALAAFRPVAIVLDILLEGEDSWGFLTEMKRGEGTRSIPILVLTTVDDARKGLALGADDYCVKPIGRTTLLSRLGRLLSPQAGRSVLVIDDEEISRYLLHQHLTAAGLLVLEAGSGEEGLTLARTRAPDAIFLDLEMPQMSGFQVLRELRAATATRDVPVVVVTSRALTEEERHGLTEQGASVVSKDALSREMVQALLEEVFQGTGGVG